MHRAQSSFPLLQCKSSDSSILPCGEKRDWPTLCRECQHSLLWKHSEGVQAAGFDRTLVFSSSLGRWCFLQMCHLVSCPQQVVCPRRNQLNILRQKVETQPPSASPPPPPVYDVSTRIALHPFCPHCGTTLPFPALPWYRQCQYHDVKHKQYLHTSLVLVTLLLCSALLSSSQDCACCVSPSWSHSRPPQCQSLAPCPAGQHPSFCQQCGSTKCGVREGSWW